MNVNRNEQAVLVVQEIFRQYNVQASDVYIRQDAWDAVFRVIFGDDPSGVEDARWDTLFSTGDGGYAALSAATAYGEQLT